MVLKS